MSDDHSTKTALAAGAEYLVDFTAYPLISLDVDLSGEPRWKTEKKDGKFSRRWLTLEVAGTGQHIPDTLACQVVCRLSERQLMGKPTAPLPGPYECGPFDLKKDGETWKLGADIDAVEAGLLGKGTIQFSLKPAMPHAPEFAIKKKLAFDVPFDVQCEGLAASATIGEPVGLNPNVTKDLRDLDGFLLRLQFVETKGVGEAQADEKVLDTFLWDPAVLTNRELDRRTWRVGTEYHGPSGDLAGFRSLSCYRPNEQGDYECGARLALSLDAGASFVPVEALAFAVKRPALSGFSVEMRSLEGEALKAAVIESVPAQARHKLVATGAVSNLNAQDLGWALRVSFWGARPAESVDRVAGPQAKSARKATAPAAQVLMAEPLSTTTVVPIKANGSFEASVSLARIPHEELKLVCSYPSYIATLAVDPRTTATDQPVPIVEVMQVDPKRFLLVDPDELLEQRSGEKAARLAALPMAEATSELPQPAPDLRCVPHLAALFPAMHGESLTFELHLSGNSEFWKKQRLQLVVRPGGSPPDASAVSEVALAMETPKGRPHVRSGKIEMAKALDVSKSGNPAGWISVCAEKLGDDPQRLGLEFCCVPSLGTPHALERQDGTWRLVCDAHAFPSLGDGKKQSNQTSRFFFSEELKAKGLGTRYDMRLPAEIAYDFRSGAEGLASAFGQLSATLKNARWLAEAKGRISLCVEGPRPDGKVYGFQVGARSTLLKDNPPQEYTHVLPYGRRVSPAFRHKVIEIARMLTEVAGKGEATEDVADSLMIVMGLETQGSFLPTVLCPPTGALGLVQFVVDGDKKITELTGEAPADDRVGHKVQSLIDQGIKDPSSRIEAYRKELASMTAEEQLEPAKNYLHSMVAAHKPKGLVEYYLCVFLPTAVSTPTGVPFPAKYVSGNPFLAAGGQITRESVAAALEKKRSEGTNHAADVDDPRTVPSTEAVTTYHPQ